MKKFYLLLLLVGLFAISCETSDEVLEDVTDNNTEQPGDDAGDGTGNGISDKEREEIVTKIFEELASVEFASGKEVKTSAEGAFLTMKFKVKPASCAPLMEKVWTHYVSMQAKYDLNSKKYVNMPIAEFDVNREGIITIKASGEYLSDEFYSGEQEAFVRFGIMFKQQQIYSEYREMVPTRWFTKSLSVPTEPNTIYYLAQDLITPQNTEVESNSYDYKKGCYKIVLKGGSPEIGERAFQYDGASSKQKPVKSIAISGNIEKIGDRAFNGCYPLTSCIIGDGVKSIGESAFYGCGYMGEGLTTLAIPDSVTEIGDKAFVHCVALESIILPRGIDRIGEELFSYCGKLTSITIPDGVTEIGNKAFFHGGLQNVNIPYTVTSIGEMAFYMCENLLNITIPEGVTEIGKDAFFKCAKLQNVLIPKSVTKIGNGAFFGCSLKELIIDSPIVSNSFGLGGSPFCETEKLIIGDNVERIGSYALSIIGSRTKSIVIPENVTSIGNDAFFGRITEELIMNSPIIEKSNINQIGDFEQIATPGWAQGFEIENMIIGDNIKRIGDAAVWCCLYLKRVTIPDSVTSLGKRAFDGCKNLISVTIPETVTEIGESVFQNCSSLQSINGKYASDDNRCLIVDGELRAFAPAGLTSYTIPNSITKIRDGVFAGCVNLTSLNIPASVTEIEGGAFNGCSGLTSITLPDKITTIGNTMFSGCSSLINITLPESITSIGDKAFIDCNSLISITIPEKVTSIGNYAFKGCSSLADIVIPDDVTSIGYSAFQNCSNLKSIKIPEKINVIAEKTFEGCSSLVSVNIPEEVFWIINNAFSDCTSLSEVYCRRTTPPTLHSSNAFHNNAAGRKFYVPRESVDAYKSADKWSDYAADIVGYDFE